MFFTIYDVSELSEADLSGLDQHTNAGDFEAVEMGLSSGELRQALLDRLAVEVHHNRADVINDCLSPYGFTVSPQSMSTPLQDDDVLDDIECVVYEIGDEALNGAVFDFTDETIFILSD